MAEPEFTDEDLQKVADSWDHPLFLKGLDVGESIGRYNLFEEMFDFYKRGEIELWIEWQTPKTMEEWKEFDKAHPELKNWKFEFHQPHLNED